MMRRRALSSHSIAYTSKNGKKNSFSLLLSFCFNFISCRIQAAFASQYLWVQSQWAAFYDFLFYHFHFIWKTVNANVQVKGTKKKKRKEKIQKRKKKKYWRRGDDENKSSKEMNRKQKSSCWRPECESRIGDLMTSVRRNITLTMTASNDKWQQNKQKEEKVEKIILYLPKRCLLASQTMPYIVIQLRKHLEHCKFAGVSTFLISVDVNPSETSKCWWTFSVEVSTIRYSLSSSSSFEPSDTTK